MVRSGGKKFYAVAIGRKTGIFPTWDECQVQIQHYPKAKFKSFKTEEEATEYLRINQPAVPPEVGEECISKKQLKKRAAAESSEEAAVVAKHRRRKVERKNPVYKYRFSIMFDGGSRGNPGVAGSGVTITVLETTPDKKDPMRRTANVRLFFQEKLTNNQAEYNGLIGGLEYVKHELEVLKKDLGCTNVDDFGMELIIQGDSELTIKHIIGEYACRSDKLKPLYENVIELLDTIQISCTCDLKLEHVYREDNKLADSLANEAMDAKRSWMTTSDDDHTAQKKVIR